MIARPLQAAAQLARGVSSAEAAQRMANARRGLMHHAVLRCVPQTDEYILLIPAGSSPAEVADDAGRVREHRPARRKRHAPRAGPALARAGAELAANSA